MSCRRSATSFPSSYASSSLLGARRCPSRRGEQQAANAKQADGGVPAGLKAGQSLGDLWHDNRAVRGDSDAERARVAAEARERASAADAAVLRELPGRIEANSGDEGRAFMDALSTATPMVTPVDRAGARSKRTEDEEIRADRQERMQQQGLSGAPSGGGWRAEARGDASATRALRPPRRGGAAELEQMLSASDASDAESGPDSTLSAEQFTLQKEAAILEQGVDVISRDKEYKPAVNTWGVFERPANISATFGGGRKLTPEDSVMSATEQQRYDEQLRKKLARFRKASGMTVDPVKEQRCIVLTQQGTVFLDNGRLRRALVLFEEACALVPYKSDVGGAAMLQQAITLDSLGRHDDALKLYNLLRTHRVTSIAKQARAMSYGFDAGKFLKADTISYAAKKEEYDPFFTALGGKWGWNTVYVETPEEKAAAAAANRTALAFAVALVAAPLGWVYWAAALT